MNLKKNGWNLKIEASTVVVYVMHGEPGHEQFVARFKYARPRTCANHFVKFLMANFTPAEYFAALATGAAPGAILEAKGYVNYNVMRARAALARRESLLPPIRP